MWHVKCPYCRNATPGRCATTPRGRSVTECCACGRPVAERHLHTHHLFLSRASDEPLPLVTPDLPQIPIPPPPPMSAVVPPSSAEYEDPFLPTGFITAFSTWSLERAPVLLRGAASFSGHLAELERALDSSSSSSEKDHKDRKKDGGGPMVSVDHLRAYLQILEVSSILGLDHDIADNAFQLFRDCCSATCMRNRSVEALATAALVHAIREAQEPRTLQEISTASNLPQKEIGKYIKILGESLQLSQPINSNSIAVHMPRFCSLLQLNKSAQELAAHIGEVVVNKCFCTRRNPISISAAAIYLACQLEDKRKTQAEICKVTGLTEVTLRKVYKELLENWDDLLPPNYTPAVPPEKAFPMTTISTVRSSAPKVDTVDPYHLNTHQDKDKRAETVKLDRSDAQETSTMVTVKEEADKKGISYGHSLTSTDTNDDNQAVFWQPHVMLGKPASKSGEENNPQDDRCINLNEMTSSLSDFEQKVATDLKGQNTSWFGQSSASLSSKGSSNLWQSTAPPGIARFPGAGSRDVGNDVDCYHSQGK